MPVIIRAKAGLLAGDRDQGLCEPDAAIEDAAWKCGHTHGI